MIIFTTGRMNVMGCPVAPTLKVTGNPCTAQRMADNIAVDVSRMLTGESLVFAGTRLFALMLSMANGRLTRAEALDEEGIAISRIQPTR